MSSECAVLRMARAPGGPAGDEFTVTFYRDSDGTTVAIKGLAVCDNNREAVALQLEAAAQAVRSRGEGE